MKIAIIIVTAFLTIAGIIVQIKKWKKIKPFQKGLIFLAIALALMICITQLQEFQKDKKSTRISQKIGEIKLTHTELKASALIIRGSTFGLNGVSSSMGFVTGDNKSILVYRIVDNKLFSDFTIRDENEKIIAAMFDNEWKMYQEGYDYNNDASGFEIVTGDRRVVFQMEVRGDRIYFAGMLVAPGGQGLYAYSDKATSQGFMKFFYQPTKKFTLPDLITPMFKYPRERHLGERND